MSNWAILENETIVNIIIADTKEIAEEVTEKEAVESLENYVIGDKIIDGVHFSQYDL
jgi:hypothetical protein